MLIKIGTVLFIASIITIIFKPILYVTVVGVAFLIYLILIMLGMIILIPLAKWDIMNKLKIKK